MKKLYIYGAVALIVILSVLVCTGDAKSCGGSACGENDQICFGPDCGEGDQTCFGPDCDVSEDGVYEDVTVEFLENGCIRIGNDVYCPCEGPDCVTCENGVCGRSEEIDENESD